MLGSIRGFAYSATGWSGTLLHDVLRFRISSLTFKTLSSLQFPISAAKTDNPFPERSRYVSAVKRPTSGDTEARQLRARSKWLRSAKSPIESGRILILLLATSNLVKAVKSPMSGGNSCKRLCDRVSVINEDMRKHSFGNMEISLLQSLQVISFHTPKEPSGMVLSLFSDRSNKELVGTESNRLCGTTVRPCPTNIISIVKCTGSSPELCDVSATACPCDGGRRRFLKLSDCARILRLIFHQKLHFEQ